MSLADRIRDFFQRLPMPHRVVAAVSGGPDSVALTHLMLDANVGPVVIAHLNHSLRGPESAADADFVQTLATKLGIKVCIETVDVRAQAAARRANLEQTARSLRYDWLVRVALDHQSGYVATGHTANDQAETVLHRILRGSSLRGLRGIAVDRPFQGIQIVRPLLATTRSELLEYLHSAGHSYRTDASNSDLAFTRNRLRQELIPLLERDYNPRVVEALVRLADHASIAYGDLERRAQTLLNRAERPRAGQWIILDRACLHAEPAADCREMLHVLWEREGWPLGEMGFDAWERVLAVLTGAIPSVDLPGGVRIRCLEHFIQVGRTDNQGT